MEQEFFDVVTKGTSLFELKGINLEKKTIVVDNVDVYGTSYRLSELKRAVPGHITQFRVNKDTDLEVTIETIPHFLSKSNLFIERLKETPFSDSIDYIKIENIFYITKENKATKIPFSLTEMHKSPCFTNSLRNNEDTLSLRDLYWYSKAMRTGDISLFLQNASSNQNPLQTAIRHNLVDASLYNTHLLYPQHGITALSEFMSLALSSHGIPFCLNSKLIESETSDHGEHKFRFSIPEAEIFAKEVVRREMPRGVAHVRVIVTDFYKFTGNFKAFVETEQVGSFVTVYGLDEISMCVPTEHQLLYFIGESEIPDKTVHNFVSDSDSIKMDVVFLLNVDLSAYEKAIQ